MPKARSKKTGRRGKQPPVPDVAAGEAMGEGGTAPAIARPGGQIRGDHIGLPYVPNWDGTPYQWKEWWPVPTCWKCDKACLVIQVQDNSMAPFLLAEDVIVVNPSRKRFRSLETVVARVGEEVLIRRFKVQEGRQYLLATFKRFDPIVVGPEHQLLARVEVLVSRKVPRPFW